MSDDDDTRANDLGDLDDHQLRVEEVANERASIREARRLRDYTRHRDWLVAVAVFAILAGLIILINIVNDAATREEEAREVTVDLAALALALDECHDQPIAPEYVAICRFAEEVEEDPANPETPELPTEGEPGADAPPPRPEQIQAAVNQALPSFVERLIQPAVNEWFRSNPPEIPEGGMTRDEIAALIAELVPTADEVAALIPVPDDGAPGAPGVPGPTCPNGARPEVVDIPSAGLFVLCPA